MTASESPPTKKRIARKAISKKTRFEVFKRDSFKCQYCGTGAPDVVLVVDHLHPVALGGSAEILNLVTACVGCNAGKGAVPLSDESALARQRLQLEALQERREQLALLSQWQRSLIDVGNEADQALQSLWAACVPGCHLTQVGLSEVRKTVKKTSFELVCSAMRDAATEVVDIDQATGQATAECRSKAFDLTLKIARFRHANAGKPHMREVMYVRACVKNNYDLNPGRELAEATNLIEGLVLAGRSRVEIKAMMYAHRSFWQWIDAAKAELGLP